MIDKCMKEVESLDSKSTYVLRFVGSVDWVMSKLSLGIILSIV